jgi:hypothetical protein
LCQEAVAGADFANEDRLSELHFDARADGKAVAAVLSELNCQKIPGAGTVIAEVAKRRRGAIAHPQVHVAVAIPVRRRQAAGIVIEVESANVTDRRPARIAAIEKNTIAFVPAERLAAQEAFVERLERAAEERLRVLRHADLFGRIR